MNAKSREWNRLACKMEILKLTHLDNDPWRLSYPFKELWVISLLEMENKTDLMKKHTR